MPAPRPPLICALSAVFGLALWLALAWFRAGVFEYPLDDVYIHLAMAKGIAGGTYGINPGEPASAASSILYPVLLVPFAGTEFQRMLPLMWNAIALVALAWSFGLWIERMGLSRRAAVLLAILAPFALSTANVAALGMEHTLHALATMALVWGIWSFVQSGRVGPVLVTAAVLSPLMRYEGLALSLLAAGLLAMRGRFAAGLGLALAVVLPLAAFSLFLLSQGLEPLPSSVLAKIAGVRGEFDPLGRFALGLTSPGAAAVVVAYILFFILLVGLNGPDLANRRLLLRTIWLAATAHLVLGQIGWMNRYEHYVMVMLGAGLVMMMASTGRKATMSIAAAMSAFAIWYGYVNVTRFTWSPQSVHLQQAQMARFASSLPGEVVAANDIGWLAWGAGAPVLDLWGLASPEARQARTAGNGAVSPGWADRIVKAHGVRYAMIYPHWIAEGIGPEWQKVAVLTAKEQPWSPAARDVVIYATDPAFVAELQVAVRRFQRELPPGAALQESR